MLPSNILNLVLGVLLSFSTPALANPVLTIFCKSQTSGELSQLATLPSDVRENYLTPDIVFKDENSQPFQDVLDDQPFAGDDLKIQLMIRAQSKDGKVNIYRSLAHVGRRLATSQILFGSRGLTPEILENLKQRGLPSNLMAQHENTFVFAGASSDEFLIYDLKSQAVHSVHLQNNLANPRFSVTGNFLIFDLFDKKTYRWQQVAYDFGTFKVAFQTTASNFDTSSLEYNSIRKNWVWLELDHVDKAAELVESNGKNKVVLNKLIGSLSLPFVYSATASSLKVYWTEHSFKWGTGPDGQSRIIFSKAQAQALSLELASSPIISWPFPETLVTALNSYVPDHLMAGGFKVPSSDEIIFSLDSVGGLIALNTTTGLWRRIAKFYPCLQPHWTFQGPTQ